MWLEVVRPVRTNFSSLFTSYPSGLRGLSLASLLSVLLKKWGFCWVKSWWYLLRIINTVMTKGIGMCFFDEWEIPSGNTFVFTLDLLMVLSNWAISSWRGLGKSWPHFKLHLSYLKSNSNLSEFQWESNTVIITTIVYCIFNACHAPFWELYLW